MSEITLLNYGEIESSKEIVATKANNQKSSGVTITSLEIAELTGKRHDHILRDIEVQLSQIYGAGGVPKFGDTYQHPQNKQLYKMYRLPKKEALLVISGYDVKIRMAIIDRLEYLENEFKKLNQPKLPQTYAEALREILYQVEENERLQIENADQKEVINSYKIADKQYNKQYARCYNEIYAEFAKFALLYSQSRYVVF